MIDPISEIKSRLTIEELVSQYVPLKKAGKNLKAFCPFHQEKTPSFMVSPEKQIAYCFGCGRGGDIFKFIQEIEGVSFKEALEILAERANVKLPSRFFRESKEVLDRKKTLEDIHETAQEFFSQNLWQKEPGQKVLDYLKKRGLKDETIKNFGLGFAPESFEALTQFLLKKGFSKKLLVESGLAIAKDLEGEKIRDRFYRRLMFPIFDVQGKVVAFGGRALKKEDEPKYLNSPESPLYHKSNVSYGLNFAKTKIKEENRVVVVEGYMDVLSSYQAGVRNVVASSGTALTESQLKLLQRFTKNIVLAFDADQAGEEALRRATELAQKFDLNLLVARIPEGKDPDECIKKDPKLWIKAVREAPFYLDFFFEEALNRFSVQTLRGQKEVCNFFFPILKGVSHDLERSHFLEKLAFKLKVKPDLLYDEFNRLKLESTHPVFEKEVLGTGGRAKFSPEEYLLGLIFQFLELSTPVFSLIFPEILPAPIKKLYKLIQDEYNLQAWVKQEEILKKLSSEEKEYLEVLAFFSETKTAHLGKEAITEEILNLAERIKRTHRKIEKEELMLKIKEAHETGDQEKEKELFLEYSRLV